MNHDKNVMIINKTKEFFKIKIYEKAIHKLISFLLYFYINLRLQIMILVIHFFFVLIPHIMQYRKRIVILKLGGKSRRISF